jgi:hypothetical protein
MHKDTKFRHVACGACEHPHLPQLERSTGTTAPIRKNYTKGTRRKSNLPTAQTKDDFDGVLAEVHAANVASSSSESATMARDVEEEYSGEDHHESCQE